MLPSHSVRNAANSSYKMSMNLLTWKRDAVPSARMSKKIKVERMFMVV
jgi:hypothetical protein